MPNWLYKLILRLIGRLPPRQTDKTETEAVLQLREKYQQWGKK